MAIPNSTFKSLEVVELVSEFSNCLSTEYGLFIKLGKNFFLNSGDFLYKKSIQAKLDNIYKNIKIDYFQTEEKAAT